MNSDSQAVFLLCATMPFDRKSDGRLKPLTATEFSTLARRLKNACPDGPAQLLGRASSELKSMLDLDAPMAERLAALLERGSSLAMERQRLADRGIWIMTRVDEDYPEKLRRRLTAQSPPVLYGAGPRELLSTSGIAIVGSRDIDEAGVAFARTLGELCARSHQTLYSGGARGSDREAMGAAVERGGSAVGVLADSLERTIKDPGVRRYVLDEQAALATPYHPSAGFSVGNAMGRNRLIYCLSDLAVVVATAQGSGGTWAGATENLDAGWVPLVVWDSAEAPTGNKALLGYRSRSGARAIPVEDIPADVPLQDTFAEQLRLSNAPTVDTMLQGSLDGLGVSPVVAKDIPEEENAAGQAPAPQAGQPRLPGLH